MPILPNMECPSAELEALSQGSADQLLIIATDIGAQLGVSFGLAFNAQNTTGRYLNRAAQPNIGSDAQIWASVRRVFNADTATGIPPIFAMVLSELTHVSQVLIQKEAFKQGG